jgi:hypothetical protein
MNKEENGNLGGSAVVAASSRATAGLPLPDLEKVTIRWLIDHVPAKTWWSAAVGFAITLSGAFSVGLASANTSFVQELFAKKSETAPSEFLSKAITEKSSYVLGTGMEAINFHVADVSIKRRLFKVEIGQVGRKRTTYEVAPNEESDILVGAQVYTLVVHDLADAAIGQDVAVVSFTKKASK